MNGTAPFSECVTLGCSPQFKGFPTYGGQECPPTSCYNVDTGHQRQCNCEQCIQKRQEICGQYCPQHTEGNEFQDLKKTSHDPEIQAIRDRMGSSQHVRESLQWCPDDETLTCVDRRFRQAQTGLLGKSIVHYGAAQDCDFPKEMRHGIRSETVNQVAKILSPPLKHWPAHLDTELKESIYASNRFAPIGKSHDQTLNLPAKIDPEETLFGRPTDKDISAGILVNPPKSKEQVESEYNCCRQLYRKTHGGFKPGEQICRNYEDPFKRTTTFGQPTPCDIGGRLTKKMMSSWRACQPDPPYVNKVYADHLDQRYPKLGLAQDRHCLARTHGHCVTYGKKSEDERERPIREIIFNRCNNPSIEKAQTIMHSLKEWLAKVRKSFKSASGPDLESFYEALVSFDEERNGTIDWRNFITVLHQEKVPCLANKEEFMEILILSQVYHPLPCNKVNYYALMDLIKGFQDPMFCEKTTDLNPWYIPWTNGCTHFRTTYSDFAAPWCLKQTCLNRLKNQVPIGKPSVRRDDENAYSLIWPSVYTIRGITCRDAFCELTDEQMKKILCYAAVSISHDEFEKVVKKARDLDPDGKERLSYQTFREALHIHREEENKSFGYSENVKIRDCCHHNQNSPESCSICECLSRGTRRHRGTVCSTGI